MPIIFKGDEKFAYRDPACYFANGTYHLFFTVSEKENGYMYNRVAHSVSKDLKSFSDPEYITEKNYATNFCSPGNVIRSGDEYLICVSSYPMPFKYSERPYADDSARLFFIKTRDFVNYSSPLHIYPKGEDCQDDGRMIDPFILKNGEEYLLFFKQNGVSLSRSLDLKSWEYVGRTDGGENACVITEDDRFILIHSPENGIGVKASSDLKSWHDIGTYTLGQGTPDFDFASGRLTAAFAMKNESEAPYKYVVFFHGSRADSHPETHGAASLALAFTDDFKTYAF